MSFAADEEEDVAGVQFDIVFDEANFELPAVETGVAADDAEKDVTFSVVGDGVARVVVIGFNQYIISDGVLANVFFDVNAGRVGP